MISIIINVKNGERYLAQCLDALSLFNEIVVLDNYSTDNTVAIAKSYPNVSLYQHGFCGMGKLRNYAASYAKNDWLFFVDCDEVVNLDLANTLLNMEFKRNTVYKVLRHNFYAGYKVTTSSWGEDWVLRIYNRKDTSFSNLEVHESVITKGLEVKTIDVGFIYHFPYDRVEGLMDKANFYSTLYAKDKYQHKSVNLASIPFRALMSFFKCYILKRGFLDGYEGFAISSYNAIGVFSKYLKLYELSYKFNLAFAVFVSNIFDLEKQIISINKQSKLPALAIFLLSNVMLEFISEDEICAKLKHELVVPFEVIFITSQDVAMVLNEYLIKNPQLDYVVYSQAIKDNEGFMRKCYLSILKGKCMPQIEVFTNKK